MESADFVDAETYEPEEGWRRVSLAGSERFTFESFEKPPGHTSPMHDHQNEQVCVCLEGALTLYNENGESTTIEQYDSVWLDSWEPHRVANESDEMAVGLDVFTPGRSFDFWTDREE
jgi:quercetin dioxygenase-like cupin family protein